MPILCELVNDEEDGALSEKAYQCLENLGPEVMTKLLIKVYQVCELRRPIMWRGQKTIILDIFQNRERHVYAKKLQPNEVPNPRQFGP